MDHASLPTPSCPTARCAWPNSMSLRNRYSKGDLAPCDHVDNVTKPEILQEEERKKGRPRTRARMCVCVCACVRVCVVVVCGVWWVGGVSRTSLSPLNISTAQWYGWPANTPTPCRLARAATKSSGDKVETAGPPARFAEQHAHACGHQHSRRHSHATAPPITPLSLSESVTVVIEWHSPCLFEFAAVEGAVAVVAVVVVVVVVRRRRGRRRGSRWRRWCGRRRRLRAQ